MGRLIDLHHHLLWGVDDGPDSLEGMAQMLRAACEGGLAHLAATPHATPGRLPFPAGEYEARLAEARALCAQNGLPLTIHTGCEILYTDETARLLREGQYPTLSQGKTVLVEFFPGDSFSHISHAVRTLGNEGFTVVAAHVERYGALRDIRHAQTLREEYGALLQVNCATVIRPRTVLTRWWLHQMLEKGLVDLVATDAHNTTSRPCCMQACYQALQARYGQDCAERLCVETPGKILQIQ